MVEKAIVIIVVSLITPLNQNIGKTMKRRDKMMYQKAVHKTGVLRGYDYYSYTNLCGLFSEKPIIARDWSLVTCKKCLKHRHCKHTYEG